MTDEERTRMKAAAKVEDLALASDLGNLDQVIAGMLASVPDAQKTSAIDSTELKTLVAAIKKDTASNRQSARFLEITRKLVC
jgi:hypothetical protein